MLERKIEDMENKGYGCKFADFGTEKLFPYEMITSEMMERVTVLQSSKVGGNTNENSGLS